MDRGSDSGGSEGAGGADDAGAVREILREPGTLIQWVALAPPVELLGIRHLERTGKASATPRNLFVAYLFTTPQQQREMLTTIGVSSVDELFDSIPADLRMKRPLDLPPA